MPCTIDYYFTLASPWAFLGHQAFLDLAKAHGVTIRTKPVPLGEVFPQTGGLPLPKRHPARQRYRTKDSSKTLATADRAPRPHHRGGRGVRRRSGPLCAPRVRGDLGRGPRPEGSGNAGGA